MARKKKTAPIESPATPQVQGPEMDETLDVKVTVASEPLIRVSADGLYEKYQVSRTDGQDHAGGRHFGCRLFVLDLTHDADARKAVEMYASLCGVRRPQLASDLRALVQEINQREERGND